MIQKLSKNLSMKEVILTKTGLDNIPSYLQSERLFLLARYLFQPIRDQFGPIIVPSGYRSQAVNEHPDVGGAPTSQHLLGEALDIYPLKASCMEVFEWIVENMVFGQAIYENIDGKEHVHISLPRIFGVNQKALIFDGESYQVYSKTKK